jgi:hypothetical protein
MSKFLSSVVKYCSDLKLYQLCRRKQIEASLLTS